MLRFDGKNRPAPRSYLARPMQLRLLALVAALAGVVWLATLLATPGAHRVLANLLGEPLQPQTEHAATDVTLDEAAVWLSPEALAPVRDNAPFRAAETDAWFALLAALQEADLTNNTPAAPVTYTQLVNQPQAYRGRTVRVRGTVERVEPQQPAENELGIAEYYRVILRPAGREVWPVAVYTLEAPPTSQGASPASATGVFFKNLSYQSAAGAGLMPVVLAKAVDVAPVAGRAVVSRRAPNAQELTIMVATAAAIATAVVGWIALRGRG